jgi:hypothetical protein
LVSPCFSAIMLPLLWSLMLFLSFSLQDICSTMLLYSHF